MRRLSVLGTLYVAQGVVYGFAGYVLMPSLAAQHVSLQAQTGILALAGVPWVFKLGWALLLDRKRGRPRTVAAAATAVMAVVVAAIAGLGEPSAHVIGLGALWLALNVALSLQDAAADAFALDQVAADRRGAANGVMLGGHHLGMEGLGGLALGAAVAAWNLQAGLWLLAGVLAVSAAAAILIPVEPSPSRSRLDLGAVADVLRRRSTWLVGGFAAVVLAADHLTGALSYEFLVNRLHWSTDAIASELPPAVLVGSLGGFAAAAYVADRIGHRKTAVLGSLGLGALWLLFGLAEPAWATRGFVLGFVCLQGAVTGLLYTGVHAWLMDRVDPRIRATHFAAFTALLNLPRAVMPTAAPGALARLGWSGVFLAAGGFQLLAAAALARAGDKGDGA